MAKKKQDLTQEELLEQALVSESEWPYKVPENWVWVRLGACLYSGKEKQDNFDDDATAYVGLEHIHSNNGIVSYGSSLELKSLKNVFKEGDILYGKLRPYLNKHDIAPFDGVCSTDILVLRSREITNNDYINYLIDTERLIEHAVKNSKGINLPRVSENELFEFSTPIPPLDEQQRIVDRIESLFEKLDQAKGLIKEALDSFENRKAAILHKAFSGELTKNWREKNNIGMESWKNCLLGDCVIFGKEKYDPSTAGIAMPYIGLEHIEKNKGIIGTGNSEDIRSLKTVFRTGDILYGKLRPYLNKHDIATFNGICSTDILVMSTDNFSTSRYINYLLNTSSFLDYSIANSKGINLPRVSEKIISEYEFKMPTIIEQEEIINILDDVMEKENNAFILYDLTDNIDLLKKAILARAFRGELGTNEPEEESAMELLKILLVENAGESK